MTFRQKILIAYLAILLLFLVVLFPFAAHSVRQVLVEVLEQRCRNIVEELVQAPDVEEMLKELKQRQQYSFYRIALIGPHNHLLYDSREAYEGSTQMQSMELVNAPEVQEAFQRGVGYRSEYFPTLSQSFSYMAVAFEFHGSMYVVRVALPFEQIDDLTHHLEIAFLTLGMGVLILFSIVTWMAIHHISRPIEKIIAAVKPYRGGTEAVIPIIDLGPWSRQKDEFGMLAETLNSLSVKVHDHIETLTRERNEKSTILEALVEGVVVVDAEGVVRYANKVAMELLVSSWEELATQGLTRPEDRVLMNLARRCQNEGSVATLYDVAWADRRYYLDIVAIPSRLHEETILVLQDKTTHYRALEKGKEFVANASHELKTPITIIQGFAETLHDNRNLPRDVFIEITEKILRNCHRMEKLVRNLLVLADMDTHLPLSRVQECSLEDLLNNCIQLVQTVYRTASIQLLNPSGEDIFVGIDPMLFELAITNLLDNAAKYSEPPAKIAITIDRVEGQVKITIEDHGIGIPQEDLEHIFDRFYTVNKAHSRKMGGSGLGLSICRTIIEKHLGKISIASQVGQGTTFTILLPAEGIKDVP